MKTKSEATAARRNSSSWFVGHYWPQLILLALLLASPTRAQAATAVCPAPTLTGPRTFGTGGNSVYVAVADFNGDGTPDLAVANGGYLDCDSLERRRLSILLGRADGSFWPPAIYDAGTRSVSVAVGDFNGDGKPDLAVANFGEDTWDGAVLTNSSVSILLGKGDGSFQKSVSYNAGRGSVCVVVADFNGDGKLDLAVANRGSHPDFIDGNVSVLLGMGDGAFQAIVTFDLPLGPLPSRPYSSSPFGDIMLAADFNRDGKSDLIVTGGIRTASVLFGNGDGTFATAVKFAPGIGPFSFAVGDFNADGKLDLAVATRSDVSVLLGKGDGSFQPAVNYRVGRIPGSVAVGDFNGDGKLDLFVANNEYRTNSSVSLLLGKGDGGFLVAVNYGVGTSPVSIVVSDFNGDGKPDLLIGRGSGSVTSSVSVLLGRGDGTFEAAFNQDSGSWTRSVAVGDFDGDGKADLAVAGSGLSVLLGNGDGSFTVQLPFDSNGPNGFFWPADSVAVGEFNGDGKADLVVDGYHGVSLLLGKGDGAFYAPIIYGAAAVGCCGNAPLMAVGDFNGDGRPDLAVADDINVSVLLNTCVAAAPELAIMRSANSVMISWPASSTGLVLEFATSLTSPADWKQASEVPVQRTGRFEVTAPANLPNRYFRLRKP